VADLVFRYWPETGVFSPGLKPLVFPIHSHLLSILVNYILTNGKSFVKGFQQKFFLANSATLTIG
jgi:hypothetical protein